MRRLTKQISIFIILLTCLFAGVFYWLSAQELSQIYLSQTADQILRTKEAHLKDTVENVVHQIELYQLDKRFELEAELSQIEADLILIDQNHESQIDFEQTLLQYFNQKPANKWHYSLDALDEDSNDEFVLEKTVEVRNYAIKLRYPKAVYDQAVLEHTRELIYRYEFDDNSYIWINQIINYDGGDDFAIRLVHPNLRDTEGMLLSTYSTDVNGTTPYLTELEGVIANGDIYSRYYFQKKDSDAIKEKLTYAKLFVEYDWVIAYGVYIDDTEIFLKEVQSESRNLVNNLVLRLIVFLIAIITLGFGLITFMERRAKQKETEALKLELDRDALTMAYSRRAFDFYLPNAYDRFKESGISPLFLLVDIDDFKDINDQYGHATGDQALKAFAKTIIERNRKEDRVYRLGGDEFVLVYEGVREENDETLSEIILESVRGIDLSGLPMTCSIGFGRFSLEDTSGQDLLNRIDKALYKAKLKGKNTSSK